MILSQLETAVSKTVELVDKASAASDRWLFLAALAIIILGGATVIWWLVKSLETKGVMQAEERKEWKAERKEENKEFLSALVSHKIEITELTKQLSKNTEVLTAHDRDMREAHRIETVTLVHAELTRLGIDPSAHLKKSSIG